jgi:hypothetical protein
LNLLEILSESRMALRAWLYQNDAAPSGSGSDSGPATTTLAQKVIAFKEKSFEND